MRVGVAGTAIAVFTTWRGYWETFLGLPAAARAVGFMTATVVLAVIVVGLFPGYGQRSAEKAREHAVLSTLVGAIVAGLFFGSAAALWYGASQSAVVSLLALPLLFVLCGIAAVWLLIGVVAIGEILAGVAGRDGAAWGITLAGVLGGLGALYPVFGAVVLALGALLGFGSGIRTNPFATHHAERSIPADRNR
jgi:hypothetical protein